MSISGPRLWDTVNSALEAWKTSCRIFQTKTGSETKVTVVYSGSFWDEQCDKIAQVVSAALTPSFSESVSAVGGGERIWRCQEDQCCLKGANHDLTDARIQAWSEAAKKRAFSGVSLSDYVVFTQKGVNYKGLFFQLDQNQQSEVLEMCRTLSQRPSTTTSSLDEKEVIQDVLTRLCGLKKSPIQRFEINDQCCITVYCHSVLDAQFLVETNIPQALHVMYLDGSERSSDSRNGGHPKVVPTTTDWDTLFWLPLIAPTQDDGLEAKMMKLKQAEIVLDCRYHSNGRDTFFKITCPSKNEELVRQTLFSCGITMGTWQSGAKGNRHVYFERPESTDGSSDTSSPPNVEELLDDSFLPCLGLPEAPPLRQRLPTTWQYDSGPTNTIRKHQRQLLGVQRTFPERSSNPFGPVKVDSNNSNAVQLQLDNLFACGGALEGLGRVELVRRQYKIHLSDEVDLDLVEAVVQAALVECPGWSYDKVAKRVFFKGLEVDAHPYI
jgi:hypothetical protein